MSLNRFALLTLVCMVVYGFSVSSVKAYAKEVEGEKTIAVTREPEAVVTPEATAEAEATPEVTVAPVELSEPVGTPAVNVPAVSKITNSNTASPVVKKAEKQKKIKTVKKKVAQKKKAKKKAAYSKAELRLMASIINCEAGAECFQGKIAVGIVVMNRIKSSAFPNTLKGVIYQKYQFSPVRNGSLHKRLSQYDKGQIHSAQWKACILAAKRTLSGQNTILMKGKIKNMKGVHFFSVGLSHAKFKLGGHRFK